MLASSLLAAIAFAGVNVASSSRLRISAGAPRVLAGTDNVKHILHFSDVHLNISKSLNATESAEMQFGCGDDAPIALLTSALDFAKKLMPDPDFFLYTGDHVVHGDLTDELLSETVETNVETMAHYYTTKDNDTNLDVTTLLGNADTSLDYTLSVTDPETETNPSITLVSAAWQDTLSKSNLDWFNHQGYLTYDLDEKLVVLTLNTVPYSPSHYPDTTNNLDPFGQFAWLNETLLELRNAGKFAYVVGHIPPIIDSYSGAQMWEPEYIKTYKLIVSQFTDIIKAQFFAHVHSIEFRVSLISEQQQLTERAELVPLFMSAAISPIYDNNPAFMIWDFDATTYEVLDFTVYGTNISSDSQELDWQPLFKASTAYGVASLRTSELNAFVVGLDVAGAVLLQLQGAVISSVVMRGCCLSVEVAVHDAMVHDVGGLRGVRDEAGSTAQHLVVEVKTSTDNSGYRRGVWSRTPRALLQIVCMYKRETYYSAYVFHFHLRFSIYISVMLASWSAKHTSSYKIYVWS